MGSRTSPTYQYDVFISYTRRRHLAAARRLALSLTEAGYSVWFDEHILERKTSWRMEPKKVLMALLAKALQESRIAVMFAIAQEVIPPVPFDAKAAVQAQQVIRGPNNVWISWNWQVFESQQANSVLVLYREETPFKVIDQLRRLNVLPSRPLVGALTRFVNVWRAMALWISRRRRVALLSCALPLKDASDLDPGYLECCLFSLSAGIRSASLLRHHVALIGDPGVGRTSLLDRAADFIRDIPPHRSLLRVELPLASDVDFWAKRTNTAPTDTILVFDDFIHQLEARPLWEREQILGRLYTLLQWRTAVFVLTQEETHDSLIGNAQKSLLDTRFPVECIEIAANPVEVLQLVTSYWIAITNSGRVTMQTQEWSPNEVIDVLQQVPVFDDLRPVDYRDLQGSLLCPPANYLAFMNAAVKHAIDESTGGVPCITDATFDAVLKRSTGFAEHLIFGGRGSNIGRVVASRVADHLPLEYRKVQQAVETAYLKRYRSCPSPLAVLSVKDRDIRRRLAQMLALNLLGSSEAVLIMDYGEIKDQILNYSVPYTDTFRWMVRSVRRFPWWVVVIEEMDKATHIDRCGVRTILSRGVIENTGEGACLFDRCIMLFDSDHYPEIEGSTVSMN